MDALRVNLRNCKRYKVEKLEKVGQPGIIHHDVFRKQKIPLENEKKKFVMNYIKNQKLRLHVFLVLG